MTKTTPASTDVSETDFIQAGLAMGNLIRTTSFRRSREPAFYSRVSRDCLALRVHGPARKAVRVAIAAVDEQAYESIRAVDAGYDKALVEAALRKVL